MIYGSMIHILTISLLCHYYLIKARRNKFWIHNQILSHAHATMATVEKLQPGQHKNCSHNTKCIEPPIIQNTL